MSHTISEISLNKHITIKVLSYSPVPVDSLNLSILTKDELHIFDSFKSEKRKLEFYNCRVLWASFNIDSNILYKPTGKPFLNKGFISISHSKQKIAIAYSSSKEIGLDLEYISEKVQKVKSKYLHSTENYSSKSDLTKIWTIKEAIYKLYDSDTLSFKRDIAIKNLSTSPSAIVNYNSNVLKPLINILAIDNDYILAIAQ